MAESTAEWQARMRSIGVMTGGRPSKRGVQEYRDPTDGHRIKATTDELNNTVTEHNTKDDRVDVLVRPPHVRLVGGVREIPQETT
jgi:hypothetical protein